MTLIASGIHKHQAFMAVDSRLSVNDLPVFEDAVKCAHFECGEGKFLIGFTGIAGIDNLPTMDWILNQFTKIGLSSKTAEEVLSRMAEELQVIFLQIYGNNPEQLIVTACGWADGVSKHPLMYSISNCLDASEMYTDGRSEFAVTQHKVPSHGAHLLVLGDLRSTQGREFKVLQKNIGKHLNINSNKLDEIILDEMARLIIEASNDTASTTVNSRIRASRMHRIKSGIIHKSTPEESSYSLPGFSTPTMTVMGLRVKNDPFQGGETIIGGSFRQ